MRDTIDMAREAGDDWDSTLSTDKEFLKRFEALVRADERAASVQEPVAWPEHEFIQWGAKKYGPLVQAAINLLAEIDSNHDSKSYPQKYGVPYGAVNTLRDALTATPPAPEPLTDDQVDAAIKAWFENDIVAGQNPFRKRMRAAFAAAHGITEKGGAA